MPPMFKTPPRDGRVLENSRLLRTLDADARQLLTSYAHRKRFAQGDMIFRVGTPGQSMMAVLAGSVRITVRSPLGKEMVLADLQPGEVFGEVALLDGKDRTADAMALTNCELLVLERRDVLPFLEQHPRVCLKLFEMLCERLRYAVEHLTEIAFLELPARLAKALLRATPATTSVGANRSTRTSLSQTELGNMIGATRESVNRCLKQWEKRGIVRLDKGWIFIVSRTELEEIAGLSRLQEPRQYRR